MIKYNELAGNNDWNISMGDYQSKAGEYVNGSMIIKRSKIRRNILLATVCISTGILFLNIFFAILINF